jgi:DNA polymerase elongation subunit (family B)
MTNKEKSERLKELKNRSNILKREVDYYNALQLALKLVLNGSYGAFAAPYFILYNNNVAGTITAEGRELTKKMDEVNEKYWYEMWHLDRDLHKKLSIKNVNPIPRDQNVSIYGDTDSIFVSFKPAMDSCQWRNQILPLLSGINKHHIILSKEEINKSYIGDFCLGVAHNINELENLLNTHSDRVEFLVSDGMFVKNRDFNKILSNNEILSRIPIKWNWTNERDFIQGADKFRIADYFKDCLDKHAQSYGVDNKEDFELERISESIINIAKKKYIQNIVHEDGLDFERLSYIFPKGVELVRSSTPAFAREKIVDVVKYLFSNPDTFNIKELLRLVKNLRKEFELADIDDICMQSSCSNYEEKVIDDKNIPLKFVNGAHFAVKAAAYYNYLLDKNKQYADRYEYLKSGTKIKYYVCKDKSINDMFAYIRGSYPIEFAPEIDYNTQFAKAILSPINSIIEPLGMPQITERLSVVMDIFSGIGFGDD